MNREQNKTVYNMSSIWTMCLNKTVKLCEVIRNGKSRERRTEEGLFFKTLFSLVN